ncbi:hypothetical protein K438DRAFT_1771338 [Mycena galopus ATCC 62051]|nr:hypothetical protein K438DRAFT_1781598 [Mycena galopus ATCC 62051]KAF8175076.1 hypothetical protein K438DRAFT_1771338 [Mycena galopus ATCC 62051]
MSGLRCIEAGFLGFGPRLSLTGLVNFPEMAMEVWRENGTKLQLHCHNHAVDGLKIQKRPKLLDNMVQIPLITLAIRCIPSQTAELPVRSGITQNCAPAAATMTTISTHMHPLLRAARNTTSFAVTRSQNLIALDFSVLKLAPYVRPVFAKSTSPQQVLIHVLHLIVGTDGLTPAPPLEHFIASGYWTLI